MDDNSLPNDVRECHRLLLAAFKQSVQLEQQVVDAKRQSERQVAEAAQRVEELERVLDETATTHHSFQLLTTTNDEEGIELEYSQLVKLLGGLDLRTGRRRRRYRRAR